MTKISPVEIGAPLGQEFLIWLWHQSNEAGGRSGIDDDETAIFVDESMLLVSATGDVQQVALKKGNPSESLEAFQALARGMRPSKATFRLLDGDREWRFGLTAETLELQSVKLPKVQSKDPLGISADRLELLQVLIDRLFERFSSFVKTRMEDVRAFEMRMQQWVAATVIGS